jgi:phosphopantothenoylcysteine synthetase/decarboxylase
MRTTPELTKTTEQTAKEQETGMAMATARLCNNTGHNDNDDLDAANDDVQHDNDKSQRHENNGMGSEEDVDEDCDSDGLVVQQHRPQRQRQ